MALRADLALPRALSPRFYRDPAVLELEQERIFARTWQFAGHVSELPEPGRYITATRGRRSRCSCCATTTASCAPSATSAATAARGC